MTRLAGILRLILLATGIALPAMATLPDGYGQLVLKRSANDAVADAAAELAGLLEQTYGESPVIRRERLFEYARHIHIGTQPDHPLFDDDPLTDEILVERNGRGLLIAGSDNTATCFAVYRFLGHFLGWRYYQPGPLGLERLDRPPDPPALAGESRILLHERAAFYSRNLSGLNIPKDSPDWSEWNGLRERFKYNHAIHRIITPDLFDEHPGWFARDENGRPKRPPFATPHGYNDHPDLSNEEVRSYVSKSLSGSLSELNIPSTLNPKPLSLSLGDSFEFGHFPAGYPWKPSRYFRRWPDWSNHVFDFTNDVAARLASHWDSMSWGYGGTPELYLGALSYLTWERPPDFDVHPSIVPYLTYDRSQWYDPAAREDDLSNIDAWADKKTKVIGTWDYLFGYGFLMPRSMVQIVADSIPAIHERGIRAYYSQVMAIWPYDTLSTWLTARLLWDTGADVESLVTEFYREFYGPADTHMRTFFAIAERSWMEVQGTPFWLRYWKDPWQAALWQEEDLQKMAFLLQDALATTRNMPSKRFYERIRQTSDLFEATQVFIRYQNRMWDLQTGDTAAGGEVLALRKQLKDAVAGVVKANPLAAHAADLKWIDRYDGIGGYLFILNLNPNPNLNLNPNLNPNPNPNPNPQFPNQDQDLDLDLDLDIFWEWGLSRGYHGIPDGDTYESVLFDRDFTHGNNQKVWYKSLMDAERAVMTALPGGGGYLANSVRRGHIYQPFKVVPGDFYLGSVDVETAQSPSGEVYIRIDFFDADRKLIAESGRSRIAPTGKYGEKQTLRVLMQAPEKAASGRLFIRFFEMDYGSQAIVSNPDVHRLGRTATR